jgi:hypothetical protein
MRMDFFKYFSYYCQKIMISPCYFGPPVLGDPVCICSLNVMFQVPVTFQIYLVFKNTWEDWGNYFAFQEKL